MKRRATVATVWTTLGFGSAQLLRFGSNLILTRILAPEIFGLMMLVHFFLGLVLMLSDLGISLSIIQNPRGEERTFLNTAWTVEVVRSFVLWAILCAIAWPVAATYDEPVFLAILPVIGFSTVIRGAISPNVHVARRHMRLGRLTMLELISQMYGICVTVVLADMLQSVWALVYGAMISAGAKTILSYLLLPGALPRLAWDRQVIPELYHFGKWIFLSTSIGFVAGQCDRLLLGILIPMDTLGVYSIAMMIIMIPVMLVSQVGQSVVFPAVARKADMARDELRQKLGRTRWPLLAGMAVMIAGLSGFGDLAVQFLWDDRYRAAGWMTTMLAVGIWPTVLLVSLGPALRGIGQPQWVAYAGVARLVYLLVAIPLGFHLGDVVGVVAVVAFAEMSRYVVMGVGLRRANLFQLRQDILATLVMMAVLAAIFALRVALDIGLPTLGEGT